MSKLRSTKFSHSRLCALVFLVSGSVSPAHGATTYTTNFSVAENPISQGSKWLNGKTNGIDWADVRTSPGLAFGTQSGSLSHDDSIALLNGTWGPDQSVQATAHTVNQTDNISEEVELRLRSSLSAHGVTGYEISFRCSKTGNAYAQIVRWDGPLGSFTILNSAQGSQYGVADGDVVKATIVGSVITAYIGGVQVLQASDNAYTSGNPGIGFYLQGGNGVNGDYGFTSLTATDGSAGQGAATRAISGQAQAPGTYTTSFPLTENPISENGNWLNGKTNGLDWANVATAGGTPGFAFGTVLSGGPPYNDSTALLTGSWNANQTAQGTVHIVTADSASFEEVEVRLRSSVSAHSITGYEINCSVKAGNPYIQIVRWNGPLNSFTGLTGTSAGCVDGDVLMATASGNTISAYKNGVLMVQTTDSTYPTGSPGMGFYLQGGSASQESDFGFKSFTATGGTTTQGPAPPTKLSAIVN